MLDANELYNSLYYTKTVWKFAATFFSNRRLRSRYPTSKQLIYSLLQKNRLQTLQFLQLQKLSREFTNRVVPLKLQQRLHATYSRTLCFVVSGESRVKRQEEDGAGDEATPQQLCEGRPADEYFRLTTEGDCRDVVRLDSVKNIMRNP